MKKVAIYTGSYPDTTFLTLLARGLAENGVEVQIYGKLKSISPKDKHLKLYTYSNKNKIYNLYFLLKYVCLNFFVNFKKTLLLYRRLKNKSRYDIYKRSLVLLPILFHKPEIIHIQWIRSFEIFENMEDILQTKFIISIRGTQLSVSSFLYPEVRRITVKATNSAIKIHSISDDLTEQLLEINPSIKNKIVKINPGIDLEQFSLPTTFFRREKQYPLQIISVCRLSWKKGLDYALHALSYLHKKNINFEWTIIGEGSQKEELEFLIHDLEMVNIVKLVGKMKHNEIRNFLLESDVFLLPSIQEGFSNAVAEAQAIGLPCLVSDAEGLEENIENDKTGYVFRKRNVEELACLLEKFDKLPQSEYLKMKLNGTERAKKKYNLHDQIKAFKCLYESV
jgi:colanic acid/amylovoran biosynthesis glycosyltransferase